MRKLAHALGAGAMSLYYHVANEDDLLDGMVDLVYSEIQPAPREADWKAAMCQVAISAREALARHRWAIPLMESRTRPGPANLRHHDAVIGRLREAGFSIKLARPCLPRPRQLRLRIRAAGADPALRDPRGACRGGGKHAPAVPRPGSTPPRRNESSTSRSRATSSRTSSRSDSISSSTASSGFVPRPDAAGFVEQEDFNSTA
jgi:AcrR family transcriptional regulator